MEKKKDILCVFNFTLLAQNILPIFKKNEKYLVVTKTLVGQVILDLRIPDMIV